MRQYILQRLILLVPVLVGVSVVIFCILRVIPGDIATVLLGDKATPEAVADLRKNLGLDRPLYEQYFDWIGGVVKGDFGMSLWKRRPVSGEILRALPVTVELAFLATIVALMIGLPLGIISAIRQDTAMDYSARLISISGLAMPVFWLATLMLVLPSIWFQWIPPVRYHPFWEDPGKNLQQFAFPVFALAFYNIALVARMTRSCLLEVLRQDYVRTARSKGLRERAVIFQHALKNAALPVLTIVGNQFGYLLGGAVVVETVFTLPGIGRLTVDSIFYRDFIQVQGNILIFAAAFALINLVIDVLYSYLDPRVRYG